MVATGLIVELSLQVYAEEFIDFIHDIFRKAGFVLQAEYYPFSNVVDLTEGREWLILLRNNQLKTAQVMSPSLRFAKT